MIQNVGMFCTQLVYYAIIITWCACGKTFLTPRQFSIQDGSMDVCISPIGIMEFMLNLLLIFNCNVEHAERGQYLRGYCYFDYQVHSLGFQYHLEG